MKNKMKRYKTDEIAPPTVADEPVPYMTMDEVQSIEPVAADLSDMPEGCVTAAEARRIMHEKVHEYFMKIKANEAI